MHDELFKKRAVVARYRAGPYVETRERFLRQARKFTCKPPRRQIGVASSRQLRR